MEALHHRKKLSILLCTLLLPRLFDESFRSTATTSFSKHSNADSSMDMSSCRYSEFRGGDQQGVDDDADKESPLVLRNKVPRWHEQLQCWCLNFRGRVTVASVKNFQLIASAPQAAAGQTAAPSHDTVILQFGKLQGIRSPWTTGTRCRLSRPSPYV
jgi:hypothetical protein